LVGGGGAPPVKKIGGGAAWKFSNFTYWIQNVFQQRTSVMKIYES